jgi:hypothetical protein
VEVISLLFRKELERWKEDERGRGEIEIEKETSQDSRCITQHNAMLRYDTIRYGTVQCSTITNQTECKGEGVNKIEGVRVSGNGRLSTEREREARTDQRETKMVLTLK